jgi:hypothetical protein
MRTDAAWKYPSLCLVLLMGLSLIPFNTSAYEIGYTSLTFVDPERNNREIETQVYYPATAPGLNTPLGDPPAEGFPLVSFGHGYLIGWDDYDFLQESLVPEGTIVAFPKTGGELFPDHLDFGLDLAFAAAAILAENQNPASPFYTRLSGLPLLYAPIRNRGRGRAFHGRRGQLSGRRR